jgi:MoxR-like ATPase
MRARVMNGRWVLDDPTDLPEGTEVEIVTRAPPARAPESVYLDDKLREYIRALLAAACSPKYSASRTAPSRLDEDELAEGAKASAFHVNRQYTTPGDVKSAAPAVLRRFVVVPDSLRARDVSPDDVIRAILDEIPVP